MIRLRSIGLSRGGNPLLSSADAVIAPGERVALIGPNGSGKSSLLSALMGDVLLDSGQIELPPIRIACLEQTVPGTAMAAWRFVEAADTNLLRARVAADAARHSGDGHAIAISQQDLLDAGDASSHARVKELLAGLGFSETMSEQAVDRLSGGWRMRLNLARVLFVPSDLLLLDEPTNHLDLDAIVWLERWLTRYPGTVVVVSHDRDFLDRVAQATLSIESRQLVRYAGGYTAYEAQRSERLSQGLKAHAAQRARIERLNGFISRFRAKATKARQVQSRVKALEKLQLAAPMRIDHGIEISLPTVLDAPDPLLVAEQLDAGYSGLTVLEGVNLSLRRDTRIGVLGRNGAGKSTLIRTLVGDLSPIGGACQASRALRIGYFAQHGVEGLPEDDSPLQYFQRLEPQSREADLRDDLGRYGFSGDAALRRIGPMSGGEKARLVLAGIVRRRPHLLVLDEPTNHLDAATRDALTDALAEFEGALLLVSHDRYLLRATVDSFLLINDGRAGEFEGDLDDYLRWLQRGERSEAERSHAGQNAKVVRQDRRQDRRAAAERRAQLAEKLRPIDKELSSIEARLASIEAVRVDLEGQLSNPAIYENGARVADLNRDLSTQVREKELLESRWLELGERRESIEREFEARA